MTAASVNLPAPIAHSELGASSYSRWKECPGSVNLCRDIPKKSSIYADEGTLAHDIASKLLLRESVGREVDAEMYEAICVYLDHIASLRDKKPSFEAVEQRLDLSQYHPKLFGTADYVCYFAETKTLYVVDYKHGAGVPVEVVEDGAPNEQLMYYGLGALHMNGFPIEKIVLSIVQPRCFHPSGPVRSVDVSPMVMLDYAATLVEDAYKTEEPHPALKVGDHCRWCAAQAICPAMHKKAVESAKMVFDNVVPYDPVLLSDTLVALDAIESWAKSVRSFAYSEAEAGRIPPGFKLVDKRASRKWAPGVEEHPSSIYKVLGLYREDIVEEKIKSPAQVEKLIGKDKTKKAELEKLVVKESSGKNLVPLSDDRRSIAPTVKDVFEIETNTN